MKMNVHSRKHVNDRNMNWSSQDCTEWKKTNCDFDHRKYRRAERFSCVSVCRSSVQLHTLKRHKRCWLPSWPCLLCRRTCMKFQFHTRERFRDRTKGGGSEIAARPVVLEVGDFGHSRTREQAQSHRCLACASVLLCSSSFFLWIFFSTKPTLSWIRCSQQRSHTSIRGGRNVKGTLWFK